MFLIKEKMIIELIVGFLTMACFYIKQAIACFTYCRKRQNLRSKYGKEDGSTYALVTGGSEGIGLQLCDQLAGHGFNIVMVSRNKEKIEARIKELKRKHSSVKFVGVATDLATKTSIGEYRELI